MAAQDRADEIRGAFLDALKAQGAQVRTMVDLANSMSDPNHRSICLRLGQAGREVYLLPGVGFINVHVRSESPGWWNVLKSVKEDLAFLSAAPEGQPTINCHYVLLVGRNDQHIADGYITTDFNKPPFVKHPGIEDTKFSINEKQHLDPRAQFLSVARVAKALLDRRAKNAP